MKPPKPNPSSLRQPPLTQSHVSTPATGIWLRLATWLSFSSNSELRYLIGVRGWREKT